MFDVEKYPKLALLFPLGKLPKLKQNPDWSEDQQFIYIVKAK